MREKLETLPVTELREMAKSQGIKGTSSMRKAELVDILCAHAEKNEKKEAAPKDPEPGPARNPQVSRKREHPGRRPPDRPGSMADPTMEKRRQTRPGGAPGLTIRTASPDRLSLEPTIMATPSSRVRQPRLLLQRFLRVPAKSAPTAAR